LASCNRYLIIWFIHIISIYLGDLLGSLALLSTVKENVNISCDSLTIDTVKLLGIQNLPYLTFFLRPITDITPSKQLEVMMIYPQQVQIYQQHQQHRIMILH
jgi:hypothetical protein